jgi:PAS domain S-box-containing protein
MNPLLESFLHGRTPEYLVLDSALSIQDASPQASRFAQPPGELIPGTDVRLRFPEFVGAEHDVQALFEGRRASWKLRGIDRSPTSDRPMYIGLTAELQTGERGEQDRLVVLLEDITESLVLEQKYLQQSTEALLLLDALHVSKTYLENIIDSMADALFVTTPAGIIERANRRALDLLGYSTAELVGSSIYSILPGMPVNGGKKEHQGDPVVVRNVEIICKTKAGREIPLLISGSPVETGEQGGQGIIFLGRDLTERKQAEAELNRLKMEKVYLREEIQGNQNFEEIVGTSSSVMNLFKQIQKVAVTDSTVLLHGETGTGKELVARAIHNLSARKDKVLVKVNCAALPSGLVESELFGHEKGAFTGATGRKIGRFEFADGGTILLDEVGELPLETQVKLLRVLQEQEFERVGSTQAVHVNVRVITATNRDLEDAVRIGAFREDLYYRLNVFPLHIPPLRDRMEDLPLLTSYFISKFAKKMNKRVHGITEKSMDLLRQYRWPGNVRELANVIERAIILCDGTVIQEIDLGAARFTNVVPDGSTALLDVEREHILEILNACDGIIEGPRGAAVRLGLHPATLRSRMRKLGIRRKGSSFAITQSGS